MYFNLLTVFKCLFMTNMCIFLIWNVLVELCMHKSQIFCKVEIWSYILSHRYLENCTLLTTPVNWHKWIFQTLIGVLGCFIIWSVFLGKFVQNYTCSYSWTLVFGHLPALPTVTILVAMVSEKKFWRPKFWRKSPIGNQQIKRETYLKNYQ